LVVGEETAHLDVAHLVSEGLPILRVVAAIWALVGILGAFSLGVLALLTAQHGRLDAMNARIDGLSDRMDQLSRELREEIRTVVAAIEGRVARHETERHRA
jgi:hypothetical protein